MTKKITKKWVREQGFEMFEYLNRDREWEWEDKDGYWHLMRDDIDLLEGKKAIECYSYDNGDCGWADEEDYCHLVRNGVELTKNLKVKWCQSYDNGDWEWTDEDGKRHMVKATQNKQK
jgi:hypothetical protein